MFAALTSPFALCRLRHRSNPLGLTPRRHPCDVIARRCAQVLTSLVVLPRFACAVAEPFAVALTNEEVNGVLRARVTVRYVVLTEYARRLHEQVASLCPLSCSALISSIIFATPLMLPGSLSGVKIIIQDGYPMSR